MEQTWYPASKILPIMSYIYDLLRNISGERIGRCVITKLKPGKWIEPHIDGNLPLQPYVKYYQRIHISLQNAPGAKFSIENESFTPVTGDVYVVANHKMHSVSNDSEIDRITMIVDMRTPMFEDLKVTQ